MRLFAFMRLLLSLCSSNLKSSNRSSELLAISGNGLINPKLKCITICEGDRVNIYVDQYYSS